MQSRAINSTARVRLAAIFASGLALGLLISSVGSPRIDSAQSSAEVKQAQVPVTLPLKHRPTDPTYEHDLSYWSEVVKRIAPPNLLEKCLSVVRGNDIMSQTGQERTSFHKFFRKMRAPGVYLDLGANDALHHSNTAFFDKCLGWKGVAVEPNPNYADGFKQHRTCRHLQNCIHWKDNVQVNFNFHGSVGHISSSSTGSTSICRNLESILKENVDILGDPDPEGKYGSKINFVSLDIEGFEAPVLGCQDLHGLFSSEPEYQVWTIEVNHADGPQMRTISTAMTRGGWVNFHQVLERDGSFLDDMYIMRRDIAGGDIESKFAFRSCPNNKETCAAVDLMTRGGQWPQWKTNVDCAA